MTTRSWSRRIGAVAAAVVAVIAASAGGAAADAGANESFVSLRRVHRKASSREE